MITFFLFFFIIINIKNIYVFSLYSNDTFLRIKNRKKNKKKIWRVEDLYNYKTLVGELLGASIAVVWIWFAFLVVLFGNVLVFLAVAISLTILLGTLSGGFLKLSKNIEEGAKTKES